MPRISAVDDSESHFPAKVEDTVIEALLEVVIKLSESTFQPLFRRIHDWAFGDSSSM